MRKYGLLRLEGSVRVAHTGEAYPRAHLEAHRRFAYIFPLFPVCRFRKTPCVAKGKLNISLSQELREEFERARTKQGTFDTTAEFIASAMAAYVLQIRRSEDLAFPLEFVSDRSSQPMPCGTVKDG